MELAGAPQLFRNVHVLTMLGKCARRTGSRKKRGQEEPLSGKSN